MNTPSTTPAPQKITPETHPELIREAKEGLAQSKRPTCTPTEGEEHCLTYRHPINQPTNSAQEAALAAAREIMSLNYPPGRAVDNLAAIILRHFPSTPTQSQQPPLSPGSGGTLREAIALAYATHFMGDQTRGEILRAAILAAITPFLAQPATSGEGKPTSFRDSSVSSESGSSPAAVSGEDSRHLSPATPPLTSGEDFHVQLMNILHTHSTAEGDILSACRNLVKRSGITAYELPKLTKQQEHDATHNSPVIRSEFRDYGNPRQG